MTTAYRLASPEDRSFIVSGWSSSFRTSRSAGLIAMDDWPSVMHAQIVKVLDRPDCTTLVAYNQAEDVLAGFLSFTAGVTPYVYYCFVKQACRRAGIARGLFAKARIDPSKPFGYACYTAAIHHLRDQIPCARHDPLTARFKQSTVIERNDHGR